MESGIISLQYLIDYGIQFSQEELLYILKELVEQLIILQKHGICNRDIKPANIIVTMQSDHKYRYKIADFGIGCVLENPESCLINKDRLMTLSNYYASPEAKAIYNETYNYEYYNPYKSDVYSLGVTIAQLLDRVNTHKLVQELIDMMMIEDPDKRISFDGILKELTKFETRMREPNMMKYIKDWRSKKDIHKTNIIKISEYLQEYERYKCISREIDAAHYIKLIEESLPNGCQKIEKGGERNEFLAQIFKVLGEFYQKMNDKEKTAKYLNLFNLVDHELNGI